MANRFWIGGTGNWDGTTASSAHWATTSNGAGPATGPGTSDAAVFDGSSGGGIVTVTGNIAVQSITCGAFTGTLDFSANNNNVALTANTGLNASGTGTRTLNLGNGTWTFTGVSTSIVNISTKTNLTLNANSASFVFTATTASARALSLAATQTLPAITVSANSSGGSFMLPANITYASLSVTTPNYLAFSGGSTTTITGAMNINGASASSIVGFSTDGPGFVATISSANNGTFTYSSFREMTFAGGGTFAATNSFDLGRNTGITISAPSTSGGISRARAASGF